jgi:CHAT domain-containing protein/Tfp pilus assembly protein PilF
MTYIMYKYVMFLNLLAMFSMPAFGQSYENIKIFPLGATADSLYREGIYNKVLPYASAALKQVLEQSPTDTILLAKALYRLGEVENLAGLHKIAGKHLNNGFSYYFRRFGMGNDTAARMCWILSKCLLENYRWQEADSFIQNAIELAKINPNVSGFARTTLLWSWGNIKHNQRKYQEAEKIYRETLHWWETNDQTQNEEYAQALWALAGLLNLQDQGDDALILFQRSVDLRKIIFNEKHPNIARVYNGIGFTYSKKGDWFKARDYYLKSLQLYIERLGDNYEFNSVVMYNLTNLYLELGDDAEAEKYLKRGLPIVDSTYGRNDPVYSMFLTALGQVKQRQRAYMEAETYYTEAREQRLQLLGSKHPYYAASTLDLAMLFLEWGDSRQALPLLEQALSIQKEVEGASHTSVLNTLQRLAVCYAQMNDFEKADSILTVTGGLLQQFYGNEGKELAQNFEYKVWLKLVQGPDTAQVASWLLQAQKLRRTLINRAVNYASEREMEVLIGSFQAHNEIAYQAAEKFGLNDVAFDNTLFFKNLGLQTRTQMLHQISNSNDVTTKHNYERWQSLQKGLVVEMTKPLSLRQNTDSLEFGLRLMEQQLATVFKDFETENHTVTWKQVQHTLSPHTVAVEFVSYKPASLVSTNAVHYAALVILPQDSIPHYVYLFEEKQLAQLLEKTGDNAEASTQLYASRSGKISNNAPVYGTALYKLIWKPLDSLLQGVKTVYFSPTGLLHRVAFAALPINHFKVLTDQYQLHQLGTTRSMVLNTTQLLPKNSNAVVFGGIEYSHSGINSTDRLAADVKDNQLLAYSNLPRSVTDTFEYLPGTAEEVQHLNKALRAQGLRTQTFMGVQATEEALKSLGCDTLKSPDILHIATHGFFFPDPEKRKNEHFGDENAFKWNENPLFRSGLAMAGANQTWKGEPTPANIEDGIATAYEISHLNLSDTKLVVLSACETGLGDIKGSEGVYGLQRAFKMAGADYLIVSLWQVPDRETTSFMDVFYKTWLGGNSIHEAFAKAQKRMRKKYKEVYKWGAWVLVE